MLSFELPKVYTYIIIFHQSKSTITRTTNHAHRDTQLDLQPETIKEVLLERESPISKPYERHALSV